MASIDNAYADLWRSIRSNMPLAPDNAIFKEWRKRHAEWGAPITNEKALADEGPQARYQVFAHAIVRWTPERGVEVVSEG